MSLLNKVQTLILSTLIAGVTVTAMGNTDHTGVLHCPDPANLRPEGSSPPYDVEFGGENTWGVYRDPTTDNDEGVPWFLDPTNTNVEASALTGKLNSLDQYVDVKTTTEDNGETLLCTYQVEENNHEYKYFTLINHSPSFGFISYQAVALQCGTKNGWVSGCFFKSTQNSTT